MTKTEFHILQFISERSEMCAILPTRTDIRKHLANPDADHAVNSLWDRRLIEAHPIRRAHAPFRFQLTRAGRDILSEQGVA